MSKHTPGPWNVSPKERGGSKRIINMRDGAIAAVYCEDDSFFGDPVGEANASLIATAPELLEELEWLHSQMASVIHTLFEAGSRNALVLADTLNQRHSKRHAIIAKAQGET